MNELFAQPTCRFSPSCPKSVTDTFCNVRNDRSRGTNVSLHARALSLAWAGSSMPEQARAHYMCMDSQLDPRPGERGELAPRGFGWGETGGMKAGGRVHAATLPAWKKYLPVVKISWPQLRNIEPGSPVMLTFGITSPVVDHHIVLCFVMITLIIIKFLVCINQFNYLLIKY